MLNPLLRETETQLCRKLDTAKPVVAQRGCKQQWLAARKKPFLIREQEDSSPHQDENPKVALEHSDFLLCQTGPRAFREGMLKSWRANKVPVAPQRSATRYVSKCLLIRKDVLTFQLKQVFYLFGRWI